MKTKANQYFNSKWALLLLTLIALLLSRLMMYAVFYVWKNAYSSEVNFFDRINVWDAGWYRSLAESGYDLVPNGHENGDAANWAFFPLMPMIIRYVSRGLHISLNVAASIANSILFAIGLVVSGIYIKKTRESQEKAFFSLRLICLGAIVFIFPYFIQRPFSFFLLSYFSIL